MWTSFKGHEVVYAQTNIIRPDGRKTMERMHKMIQPTWAYIDHRNGNGLDNRRENLRECGQSKNSGNTMLRKTNTSGYKGVSYEKDTGKWLAQIRIGGKKTRLGSFLTPEQAGLVYDAAARAEWRIFACLNFPKKKERGARPMGSP